MTDNKQAILVKSISDAVKEGVKPEFAKMSEMFAKLTVTLNSVQARIELIEATAAPAAGGAKRPVRGKAAGGAAAKKGAAKPKIEGTVTNALLYFRKMIAEDIDNARNTYITPEMLEAVAENKTVAKCYEKLDSDPEKYWSAVGQAVWKDLTKPQQDEVRDALRAHNEAKAHEAAEPQLEAEATADAEAAPEAEADAEPEATE